MTLHRLMIGDVHEQLAQLPDQHFHTCVTSPPYWALRDYQVSGQLGCEPTPDAFVEAMLCVFRGVWRVLRDDGTLWLNLGDTYNAMQGSGFGHGQKNMPAAERNISASFETGLPPKSLVGIPWRVALALQAEGWILRSEIIWHKKSPMPESCTDRPTKSHEHIFLLTKSPKYFYDTAAARDEAKHAGKSITLGEKSLSRGQAADMGRTASGNGTAKAITVASTRNWRDVWTMATEPYPQAHFATFPSEIPRRAILAGTSPFGCCPQCGQPWDRITVSEPVTRERKHKLTKRTGEAVTGNHCANTVAGSQLRTSGIALNCGCPVGNAAVPCRVLEPFAGSGTTLAVATALGRESVGIELSETYAELIPQRIQDYGRRGQQKQHTTPAAGQRSLFE